MKYQKYTLDDVRRASSQELFTVVSTFAGMGGSSLGYRMAGAKILLINEFVEAAIDTYSNNFPDTKVIAGDIKEFSGEDFLEAAGVVPGEVDIFDGSPPCSAFSVAGKVSKGWDKTKTYSDGKKVENIEDLFLEFIRIADTLQPKVIIAENVRGLVMGESKKKFNEFLNAFNAIGYQSIGEVVSSINFNTPQTRERTIFICVRNDVVDTINLRLSDMSLLYPSGTNDVVSIGEGLEGVVNDEEQLQELFDYVQGGFQKKWIPLMPKNPDRLVKASEFNEKGSLFNMIRTCKDLPCPTITQRGQQKSVSGCVHWAEDRKFTIPELKRIQGMPEDFELTGTFDEQAERIGRSVAPKMMCAIAMSVYKKIIRPYNEIQEHGRVIHEPDWSDGLPLEKVKPDAREFKKGESALHDLLQYGEICSPDVEATAPKVNNKFIKPIDNSLFSMLEFEEEETKSDE